MEKKQIPVNAKAQVLINKDQKATFTGIKIKIALSGTNGPQVRRDFDDGNGVHGTVPNLVHPRPSRLGMKKIHMEEPLLHGPIDQNGGHNQQIRRGPVSNPTTNPKVTKF